MRFPFPYPIFVRAVLFESGFLVASFPLGDGCDGILLVCFDRTDECEENDTKMPAVHDGSTTASLPNDGRGNDEKENIMPPAGLPEESSSLSFTSPDHGRSSSPLKPNKTTNTPTKRPSPPLALTSSGFREAKKARHHCEGDEMLLIGAALALADPTDTCLALSDTQARNYVERCRQIMRKSQDDEDEVRRRS